ncbi:urease accessory protein D isoform X1 [Senna tora]|uniref:Urease accessory protein D isoform X1 n=1 Tax=Senna tora TaxID=362788 RepID=A0A834WGY0_9FABA|nr:urease accessory protein D isoform X1 [Senna tora]
MNKGEKDEAIETGVLVVEKVGGRSSATRCLSKYPLKFIIPTKVGSSKIDAVWVYMLTYGGGIVSGDRILCKLSVGNDCTTVLTTQASTKVYKSLGSKCSEQILEARVGSNALLAIIPDPVTCFSTARYSQKQVFKVSLDSSLVIVDWVTSGRHESGEKWDFDFYRSTNNIFLEDDQPLFLDTILLDKEKVGCVEEYMQDYQVIAMIVLLGPKVQHVHNLVQDHVKRIMSEQLQHPSTGLSHQSRRDSDYRLSKPSFVASCSNFGTEASWFLSYDLYILETASWFLSYDLYILLAACSFSVQKTGLIVRVAATTTESVYKIPFIPMMLSAKSESDITSLAASSPSRSPKRPVYYVQSPSRDSHDGDKSSMQTTPISNSPMESPSHPSFGRHSRNSSASRSFAT